MPPHGSQQLSSFAHALMPGLGLLHVNYEQISAEDVSTLEKIKQSGVRIIHKTISDEDDLVELLDFVSSSLGAPHKVEGKLFLAKFIDNMIGVSKDEMGCLIIFDNVSVLYEKNPGLPLNLLTCVLRVADRWISKHKVFLISLLMQKATVPEGLWQVITA